MMTADDTIFGCFRQTSRNLEVEWHLRAIGTNGNAQTAWEFPRLVFSTDISKEKPPVLGH
jgi:hypothetical protein